MNSINSLPKLPPKRSIPELCVDYFIVDIHKQDFLGLYAAIDILLPHENKRRKAFKTDKLRSTYAFRTAIFRTLIAHQLGTDIEKLSIAQNKYGKPFVEKSSLRFNASYSSELAIYAFSNRQELGVDIEKAVPFPDEVEGGFQISELSAM